MDNSDLGETSCRKKGNNDKMSEGECPLKKAKYPWQIKGKCHLKDQDKTNENVQEEMEINSDEAKENISIILAPDVPSSTNNLEILGDYLLKQDFNIPSGDSTDSDGNSDMEDDEGDTLDVFHVVNNTRSNTTHRTQPSASCSSFNNSTTNNNQNESQPSLVEDKSTSIDTCIARWQARQIAKGFVDNTINRVLDSWLVAPLPETYDDTHNFALDVAEFFDNLPANNTVENEGILMAISAHGLQNNQNTPRNNANETNRPAQRRNYGSRMTIAITECVSRNESHVLNAENQESGEDNSAGNLILSQSEHLPDSKDNQDPSNVCQPIPTTSTTTTYSNSKLDHRKSHSENELSSTFVESRSSNNSSILNDTTWRPIPQPCSCSHTRNVNNAPTIPFHKRDGHSYTNNTSINHYCSSLVQSASPDLNATDSHNDSSAIEESMPPILDVPSPEPLQVENDNQEYEDHFDFMDAAVSFAIQNKGLTSFSSVDYG